MNILSIVAKGADDDGVVVWGVAVTDVVIDVLFVRRERVDCVVDMFVGLVVCIGHVLFKGLDDIGFITGDKDGQPVLLTLLIMR
jgi:hypothetical protein